MPLTFSMDRVMARDFIFNNRIDQNELARIVWKWAKSKNTGTKQAEIISFFKVSKKTFKIGSESKVLDEEVFKNLFFVLDCYFPTDLKFGSKEYDAKVLELKSRLLRGHFA